MKIFFQKKTLFNKYLEHKVFYSKYMFGTLSVVSSIPRTCPQTPIGNLKLILADIYPVISMYLD